MRRRGIASWTGSLPCWPRACIALRGRSTSTPATGSWPCSAPRSPMRTTRSAPATPRCVCATLRRYAQELRRTLGLDFAVRIGLNSGEVVVGKIGDDLRMDYTAQGHTVGLAARMEQIAEAGTVYLTAHTAALVGGYFQLDDLGDFAIKGVREPLHVYQLRDVGALRTRFDVSRARGFSRFVGRTEEMARLEAALAR